MNTNRVSERQGHLWLAASMAAPLAKAASGCSWPAVLAMGAVTLLIERWLTRYRAEPKPWQEILQSLWASVVISEMLHWCGECWPTSGDARAVALILLALCIWLACKGRSVTARAGCTLIWPVGLLLGLILFSAATEIKAENLMPIWQMPCAHLVTVLLITTLYTGRGEKRSGGVSVGLICFSLAVSVITAGVLSNHVSGGAGLYELSRSISFFGVSQRLESVAAVGMTLGYFGGIGYLLSIPEETTNRSRMVLAYGALAGLLFLANIRFDSRIIAIGSVLLWVVLPSICSVKNIFQKTQNST